MIMDNETQGPQEQTDADDRKALVRQVLTFAAVGGISTIINYALFLVLLSAGTYYTLASACGYILGVFVGFFLNRNYTFVTAKGRHRTYIIRYLLVYAASLLMGLAFLEGLVMVGVPVLVANVLNIALTTATNFGGLKLFVFETRKYASRLDFLIFRYKYLIRYVIIGFCSIVVEVLAIAALKYALAAQAIGIHPYVITATGFLAGVLFSFILNTKLNFPVSKKDNARTFSVFLAISALAFGLNILLMAIVGNYIETDYNVMRFFTAAAVFAVSYTLHRRITFAGVKDVGIAIYLRRPDDSIEKLSNMTVLPDYIHLDLVDRTYNENAAEVDVSVGNEVKEKWPFLRTMTHVMSRHPSKWVDKVAPFSDWIVFHSEMDEDIEKLKAMCKARHRKVGIALMPATPIESIEKYLKGLDLVLVLGISKPGEYGQSLSASALSKLELLAGLRDKYGFELCFDGGVKLSNIHKIDAKYIVSGSAVLNADNPKGVIHNLKTSSKYYLEHGRDLKKYLSSEIRQVSSSVDFIESATVVGSFQASEGLEGISDIDIIIIVDELTKGKFDSVVAAFEKLREPIATNYDHKLIINPTFGPLKFNQPNTVVFHLMIYDKAGHAEHCIKSPFTCLDWQLSRTHYKKPMAQVYAVTALQPNHFFSARRGINDYLKDLKTGVISYREYDFSKTPVATVEKAKKMDDRDRFEFSYHIMRSCITNFLKLYHDQNRPFSQASAGEYFSVFPKNSKKYSAYFARLQAQKKESAFGKWTEKDNETIAGFLSDFKERFDGMFGRDALKVDFVRHQKTEMNSPGVFVGRKNDVEIITPQKQDVQKAAAMLREHGVCKAYCSPLLRCKQTMGLVGKAAGLSDATPDKRLLEIDYGDADGKDIAWLSKAHPKIISQWKTAQDPKFPNGENYADVCRRIDSFLSDVRKDKKLDCRSMAVCTHNVVIRCILGRAWHIPQAQWHLIDVPHIEPVSVVIASNGKAYANITAEQRQRMFSKITFQKEAD